LRVGGLGERFLSEVQQALNLIEERPEAGSPWLLQGIPAGVRHVPLRTFRFSIVYVLSPRPIVIAVAHGSQKPTYWIDRLDEIETP
jgi:hypothetical protein